MGTLAALFRDTWIDYTVRILTIGGLSIPSFWFGMLIMLTLLGLFNWLPPITFTPIYVDPIANLTQLIWPAMAVGYRYCAVVARMIRSSLLEVLNEDYIRTARAKGVYEKLVISRHALRNALLPAITVIGLEFTFLIGGLVVTEQVFNLNGIGQLFVQSVSRNDFTLIQGMVMLIAAFYVFVNLLIDLLYAVFDPRIRYGIMSVVALPELAARQRSSLMEFARQQPLGAVSFVIIFLMMFAGLFSPLGRALRPAGHRLRLDPGGAVLGALVRHRRLRPRHLLAADLRLAHRAGDRLHLVVRRLDHRRHSRRRVGLFRRQDRRLDPALRRYSAGIPADRAGAGGGRGGPQVRPSAASTST